MSDKPECPQVKIMRLEAENARLREALEALEAMAGEQAQQGGNDFDPDVPF